MNVNYAEICRASNLEADFSTSDACSIFLKLSQNYCETSIIQIQERKVKKIMFLDKKKKKNHL